MTEKKLYRFKVCHPMHGEAEVIAGDRYLALMEAAREWGLRWTTIARDCIVMQMGNTPVSRKEAVKHGKTDKTGS